MSDLFVDRTAFVTMTEYIAHDVSLRSIVVVKMKPISKIILYRLCFEASAETW